MIIALIATNLAISQGVNLGVENVEYTCQPWCRYNWTVLLTAGQKEKPVVYKWAVADENKCRQEYKGEFYGYYDNGTYFSSIDSCLNPRFN